ncbi:MAG: hypothetical protein ICV68_04845 [Pyrinomonadaceae bacterium]|nr:hypothetical protein [Pyrinomonadaceae bacterium]
MKHKDDRAKMLLIRLCCCLLLSAVAVGCGDNANVSNADNRSSSTPTSRNQDNGGARAKPTNDDSGAPFTQQTAGTKAEEACRRYESCGCQSFAQCMAEIGNDPSIEAGIGDCMIKSSCESLCAGKPDGCPKTNSGGPQRSNCSAIPCSKNSDCPADCYGGCDGVICYAF